MSSHPMTDDLVERLAAHRTLAGVPRDQLRWLAEHGSLSRIGTGEVFIKTKEPIVHLFVVLSGHISITVNRGAGPRKVAEWRTGDVSGMLPYSRLSKSIGNVVAEEPTETFRVHRDDFPAMIRDCHDLTSVLVHVMLDRARFFQSTELHDEKMLSLGRLAAGLAHELNNPASAVARSAKNLAVSVSDLDAASLALGQAHCSPAWLALLARLRDANWRTGANPFEAPLERAEREDAVADWLDRHGLDQDHAEALAGARLDPAALDELAATFDGPTLPMALHYIAAARSVRQISAEIEVASSRIHGLVSAVKGFTHMDQASVPKPVDLGRGVIDTVTVMQGKARAKSVTLRHDIGPDLPAIEGFGGELNQVWSNLIDNAIDAAPTGGHVTITAARDRHSVVVSVADDGAGIPEAIRDRIFDPFFTTKGVGEGTGLGLDIARRLIERHEGVLDVSSRPGHTEFRVTLPIMAADQPPAARAR